MPERLDGHELSVSIHNPKAREDLRRGQGHVRFGLALRRARTALRAVRVACRGNARLEERILSVNARDLLGL